MVNSENLHDMGLFMSYHYILPFDVVEASTETLLELDELAQKMIEPPKGHDRILKLLEERLTPMEKVVYGY